MRKHLDEIEVALKDAQRREQENKLGALLDAKKPVPMKECPDCKGKGGSFYGSNPPPPGAHGSWRYCKRCGGTGKVVVT